MGGVIQWTLFGVAPLLALLWVARTAVRAGAGRRARATGVAVVQGLVGLVLFYGLSGMVFISIALLKTVT